MRLTLLMMTALFAQLMPVPHHSGVTNVHVHAAYSEPVMKISSGMPGKLEGRMSTC
jgi:hypothetical protein